MVAVVAEDYFRDIALAANQLAVVADKYPRPAYLGRGKVVSEIVLGMAGIGRAPVFVDRKLAKELVWIKHWLDGCKAMCTAEPGISPAEKLVRYSIFCLKYCGEPVHDWCHFRTERQSIEKLFSTPEVTWKRRSHL